jgi:hypothetical protein
VEVFERWTKSSRVPLGFGESRVGSDIKVSIIRAHGVFFFSPEFLGHNPIPGFVIYGVTVWGKSTTVLELAELGKELFKRFGHHLNELHVGGTVYALRINN